MSIRQQNLEPSQGFIHRITAQQESLRERKEELERWKRHGDMASEVEMDRSALSLKTLMESSSNRQRREMVFYHCLMTGAAFSSASFCFRITNMSIL